jgi:hypothetical protein
MFFPRTDGCPFQCTNAQPDRVVQPDTHVPTGEHAHFGAATHTNPLNAEAEPVELAPVDHEACRPATGRGAGHCP